MTGIGLPVRTGEARLTPQQGLFTPLRYREYRYLWGAQVFSELGDWAGRLALAVLVAEKTGSTALTAMVTTASVLPYLGPGQVLAVWVNRFPRVRVIVVSDLARALLFAAMVLPLPVGALLALAFISGFFAPPFEAARNALTPLVVPESSYAGAVTLASVTYDSAILFGYAIGGGLVAALGARPVLLLNAASFIVSALLLTRVGVARRAGDAGAERVRMHDGWRALLDEPYVRRFFLLYTSTATCAIVAESLVAVYAINELGGHAGTAGVLATAIPVGAILTAVIARPRGSDTSKLRVAALTAFVGAAAGAILFSMGIGLPLVVVAFACIGTLNASRIPANAVAVLRVEDRLRGPAFTIMQGFVLGGQALGAALGGLVAYRIGIRPTIVLALIFASGLGAWGWLLPPRDLRHRAKVAT